MRRMSTRRVTTFSQQNILIAFLVVVVLYQQFLLNSYRTERPFANSVSTRVELPSSSTPPEELDESREAPTIDQAIEEIETMEIDNQNEDLNKLTESGKALAIETPGEAEHSNLKSKSGSLVTIVTGTHVGEAILKIDETTQPAACRQLANVLHLMWVAWDVKAYSRSKLLVKEALQAVAKSGVSCTLSGSRKYHMLWTFPMSWRPEDECDLRMRSVISSKSYIREKTKIYVNWFLLRPDLITFANMASVEGVDVNIAVSVGNEPSTAAFALEGCPRFNTILENRDIYKQRLLLVALSDIEHQLERMKRSDWKTFPCANVQTIPKPASRDYSAFSTMLSSSKVLSDKEICGNLMRSSYKDFDKSHLGSMARLGLFQGLQLHPIPKTVFTGPKLVFIAGLEGVGHHVFALLGRKHTTRKLYDSLTDHLCDSAWDDDSINKYRSARQNLVDTIRELKTDPSLLPSDGSNVFFLNTVYTLRDVNMYSYPWGGPRCFLKRYARVMCNIDIVELARIAEEAGIDFRVIFLKRSIGAAVVSASLHRPFGTLVSETRMLALSWALLKTGINNLDRKFTLEITYEDMINQPQASAALLAEHLGFDKSNPLYAHFEQTLTESSIEHPVGDGSRWKEEVDLVQLQFMSDLLGL